MIDRTCPQSGKGIGDIKPNAHNKAKCPYCGKLVAVEGRRFVRHTWV